MKIEIHTLPVERTAHLYQYGQPDTARFHWMACHGYAMTADQVVRKFRDFDGSKHLIIAPEGLSKFYWHESREPVASWMTKRHRLDEIDDYCRYLDKVWTASFPKNEFAKKILFGFSQGGTTMMRYLTSVKPDFDILINWGGDIPRDIDYTPVLEHLKGKRLVYVAMKRDKFVTAEQRNTVKQFAEDQGLNFEYHLIDKEHKIDREFLRVLSSEF